MKSFQQGAIVPANVNNRVVLQMLEALIHGSAMVNIWLACTAAIEVVLIELGWLHFIVQVDGEIILDHCPQGESLSMIGLAAGATEIVCQWLHAKV